MKTFTGFPLCEKCLQNASNQLPFYSDGGKRRGDGLCLKLSPRVSQHLWEISWKTSVERNINFLEVADEIQSYQNIHCTMQWMVSVSIGMIEYTVMIFLRNLYCHHFTIHGFKCNNINLIKVSVKEAAMRSRFMPLRRRYKLGDDSRRWK